MPARDRAFQNERVGAVLLLALVDHYAETRTTFDFSAHARRLQDLVHRHDRRELPHRHPCQCQLQGFAHGLLDVTRRFFVELGLPRALLRRLKKRDTPPVS